MENDDARAQQLLLEMQARLSRDPYDALGLIGSATPADIRHAFLTLTKQYHPARFSRLGPDIQRLANEVFLALRSAHDTLVRPTIKAPRQTGTIPIQPPARATTPPAQGATPRQIGQNTVGRPGAPYVPQAPQATMPRAATSPIAQTGHTPPPERTTPSATESTRPTRLPTGSPPPVQPRTRTAPQRLATPPSGIRIATPGAPARPAVYGARVAPATSPGVVAPARPPQPGDREVAPVLALLEQGQFAASKIALETLATRDPHNPRYRALLAYARGREAQLSRRLDEARVELQEALQIDPSLEVAKVALGELFGRRK